METGGVGFVCKNRNLAVQTYRSGLGILVPFIR